MMHRKPTELREMDVEVTYLEMLDRTQLRPANETVMTVVEAEIPVPELSRFLYTAVGGQWYWTDRLAWSYEVWRDYLDQRSPRS